MTKVLRTLTATGFTTVNRQLTKAEGDRNLIDLKTDTDTNAASIALKAEKEADRYLKEGLSQEHDSYKNFRGSFAATLGNDATNTVVFVALGANIFSAASDYELVLTGWAADLAGILQPVAVGYKSKTVNGFIAMPAVSCQVVWQVLGNLRAKAGI